MQYTDKTPVINWLAGDMKQKSPHTDGIAMYVYCSIIRVGLLE